jgi:DNA invertase Pin-like site-specific DNA recombinase
MRKAISYIRMSSEQQLKGNSLTRQLELTKNYAKKHDLELVDSIQDLGLSAYSGKHTQSGELGKFLQALENNEIDTNTVLLVESLDRLSRQNPLKAFTQLTTILEYGVEVHTIFDGQTYTTESLSTNQGQLFMSIGSMMRAYDESRTKSERLKRSWSHKRQNLSHKILTKNVPAWLEYDEKQQSFKHLPEMTKAVRKIFKLSIEENKGSFSITKYLNTNLDKFPKTTRTIRNNKKTTTWGESYVKKILVNPAVYGAFQPHHDVDGIRVADGGPIDDYYPPVITKAEFLLSQDKMAQRRVNGSGRKGKTFSNIFTQLLVCSSCGANIVYKDKGKPPKGGKYLHCRRATEGSCDSPSWKYEEFESAFLSFISEIPLQEIFKDTDAKKYKLDIDKKIAESKNLLNDYQVKYDNLVDRLTIVDDSLVSDINVKMIKLKQNIQELQSQIEKLELDLNELATRNPQKTQDGLIRGIKEFEVTKPTDEIKQLRQKLSALIRSLVNNVVIYNSFPKIEPWETNLLDTAFIKQFNERKSDRSEYKTLEEFISSDFGQRKLNHFQRYFIVNFTNGAAKSVQPSIDLGLDVMSKKMLNLLK